MKRVYRGPIWELSKKEGISRQAAWFRLNRASGEPTGRPREYEDEAHRKARETSRKWQRENPLSLPAHDAVCRAVKAGKLVKPSKCESCGKKRKLDAHHEDYKKPLEVKWLCRSCHSGLRKEVMEKKRRNEAFLQGLLLRTKR